MKITSFFTFAILALGFLSYSSCLDDDGNTSTNPTLCTDYNYLGFRADGQSPTSPIEVITNATGDFSTTVFTPNTSFSLPAGVNTIGNNSAAWDEIGQQLVVIDQWNNNGLWVYDLGGGVTLVNPPTGVDFITAPEFLNGQLYVVEVDFPLQSCYLRPLNISGTNSSLGPVLATISFNSLGLIHDTMGNWLYSTSDQNSKLYIMGADNILIYDVVTTSSTVVGLPTGIDFHDVVWTQDGTLLSVARPATGPIDLVRLDVTGSTATLNTEVSGLDVNPESISLVYKECGDRLHLITHFQFGGSPITTRFYEFEMTFVTMSQRDIPGWIVGIAHRY